MRDNVGELIQKAIAGYISKDALFQYGPKQEAVNSIAKHFREFVENFSVFVGS
jgi:hypothetical protein